ncbi:MULTISPECIES: DUF4878 domain-containing protein [Brevibacillus]|uniref:DUF4878 domain-containing protein n=1 Tax=Brevibacillus TaxID=55080 RepID=UPI00027199E5|nr:MULTISPECIES: DUF4878 domain-containing protein [Brevibacillus]ELK38987.1 hypothetical protein D478_26764 [Brevibacillus agri BAB-2500]EJL39011.1 Borrelia ORF-A [Brevibacillus sp. CF112]MDN4095771.1 DUF4878 domain-containing protein [Brevibacillus agri]MDR9507332.1 DUF4878 domain-containing protein [Brevibacillus agri]MED3501562.1 DUF4878 domain-containing protein [Brevibacillus agri]
MKKITFLILGLAVAGGVAFSSVGVPTSHASNDLTEAKKSVTAFVEAMNKQNVDEASKYILDTRDKKQEKDTSSKKKLQKQIKKNNQNKKVKKTEAIKLLSVDKMADDTIKAEFLIANENKDVEISLPVEKVDGEWKLIVDGSVTVENK